jgi:acetylornithine deacetylase
MKGGLTAHFAVAVALKKAGVRLGGDLLCESVIDEEWAGGGGTLAARLRGDNTDACIITEGTQLKVLRATRGGHFFDIIAEGGDPSGYFSSGEVLTPAVAMGRLLGWIDRWAKKRRRIRRGSAYRDFADPAPVQVLALEANRMEPGTPWAVPLKGGARVYFQFLPHENVPGVISEVKRSLEQFCEEDPFFSVCPPKWRDITSPSLLGHELPEDHEWTQCLLSSARGVLQRPVKPSSAPYPCDAFICQREFGIPTLLFGPSGAGGHNINEYVTVRSVVQAAEVLLATTLRWCGT